MPIGYLNQACPRLRIPVPLPAWGGQAPEVYPSMRWVRNRQGGPGAVAAGAMVPLAAALILAGCGGAAPANTGSGAGGGAAPKAASPNPARSGAPTVKIHFCTPKTPASATDPCWKDATATPMTNVMAGQMPSGFSATFQAVWDAKNVYVLEVVKDPQGFSASNANTSTPWTSDAMEVYLSGDDGSDSSMGDNDIQIDAPVGAPSSIWGTSGKDTTGVTAAVNKTKDGWAAQMTVPWSDIPGAQAGIGQHIGIDPAADTYSDGSSQNQALAWGSPGTGEQNPSTWGQLELQQ